MRGVNRKPPHRNGIQVIIIERHARRKHEGVLLRRWMKDRITIVVAMRIVRVFKLDGPTDLKVSNHLMNASAAVQASRALGDSREKGGVLLLVLCVDEIRRKATARGGRWRGCTRWAGWDGGGWVRGTEGKREEG